MPLAIQYASSVSALLCLFLPDLATVLATAFTIRTLSPPVVAVQDAHAIKVFLPAPVCGVWRSRPCVGSTSFAGACSTLDFGQVPGRLSSRSRDLVHRYVPQDWAVGF